MVKVGTKVAPPGAEAIVAVGVKFTGTEVKVAVAGVVVKLGTTVSVEGTVVGVSDGTAMGGVAVSVTGATVIVGKAVRVCATEVCAPACTVPAISSVGTFGAGVVVAGRHAPSICAARTTMAIFFIRLSFDYSLQESVNRTMPGYDWLTTSMNWVTASRNIRSGSAPTWR